MTHVELLINQARELFTGDYEYAIDSLKSVITEQDWQKEDDWESWVEVGFGQPGDLEPSPCVIYCVCSNEPGCVTNRNYRYL